MSVGLSEKFVTQALGESSSLVLCKNEKSQRWQIDFADNPVPCDEAAQELTQKIALLLQEVKANGCAAFWASHQQAMPGIQIQTGVVLKNLKAISRFFKQRVQNSDADELVDLLIKEFEKQKPQDYLGTIPPDLEYVVSKGENQRYFKAHRSILSYFDYWAKAFDHKWAEASSGTLTAPETDPDAFEKVLEWIYKGTFSWDWQKNEVEGTDISAKIYDLQQIAKTAQSFMLPELVALCLLRVAQLTDFLKAVGTLDLETQEMHALPIPPTYRYLSCDRRSMTKPANEKMFFDVVWTLQDKTEIRVNGPLFAPYSPIFRQLLDNSERNDLPSTFFKEWLRILQEGCTCETLEPFITDQNVWGILRFADGNLAKFCSRKAFEVFSPDKAHLIHSILIGTGWSDAKSKHLDLLTNLQELQVEPEAIWNPGTEVFFEKLLVKHVAHLRVLRLPKCPWVNDAFVTCIAEHCPHLQVIDLSGCRVSDKVIDKLALRCPLLQVINLKDCKTISGLSVESIANHCRQLRILYLTSSKEITDQTLETLATSCPQLQELVLNYCTKISASALAKLATNCPYLRKVMLQGCTSFNDHTLDKIATHCPQLQSLELSHCKEITSAAIEKLALHCPHMAVLKLSGCISVTDKTVNQISMYCRQLISITLNNCAVTDRSIEQLARHCPNLCEISLSGCIHISDKSVELLAEHCPNLQVVSLVGCTLVRDASIEKLLANCSQLRSCNLVSCEGISATLLKKVEQVLKKGTSTP